MLICSQPKNVFSFVSAKKKKKKKEREEKNDFTRVTIWLEFYGEIEGIHC